MILVDTSTVAPLPWKNGGGVTRELLRRPAAGTDDWTLRISVADIGADGPFSPFPGITRWFAVLHGAGVRLRFPERALNVRCDEPPLRFDGADAPGCTLLDGPTRDLNVMVRQAHADSLVSPASFRDAVEPGDSAGFGLFALQPLVLHGAGGAPVRVPAWSLAWFEPPFEAPRPWSVAPSDHLAGAQEHTLPGYWIRLLPAKR